VGARTPEELETLFEDALVLGDRAALASLFVGPAVLAVNDESAVRGDEIGRLALAWWGDGHAYVADPRRLLVARDIALIVGERGVNVARRDRNGDWKYAIVRQSVASDGGRNGQESEPWLQR
jgi:hypothetical protein